jgi:hypothetical protein
MSRCGGRMYHPGLYGQSGELAPDYAVYIRKRLYIINNMVVHLNH